MLVRQKSASPGRQLSACDCEQSQQTHSQLFVETASFSEFPSIRQPLRLISLIRNRSSRNSKESLLKKLPSPGLE